MTDRSFLEFYEGNNGLLVLQGFLTVLRYLNLMRFFRMDLPDLTLLDSRWW